jgi:hypothetical protein
MRRRQAHTLSNDTTTQAAVSRRGFLRRAGITGAVAAGLIGVADVAGLSSASAASQSNSGSKVTGRTTTRGVATNSNCSSCGGFFSCQCNVCCPPGYCCYHVSGCCGSHHVCLTRPSGGCAGSFKCIFC